MNDTSSVKTLEDLTSYCNKQIPGKRLEYNNIKEILQQDLTVEFKVVVDYFGPCINEVFDPINFKQIRDLGLIPYISDKLLCDDSGDMYHVKDWSNITKRTHRDMLHAYDVDEIPSLPYPSFASVIHGSDRSYSKLFYGTDDVTHQRNIFDALLGWRSDDLLTVTGIDDLLIGMYDHRDVIEFGLAE